MELNVRSLDSEILSHKEENSRLQSALSQLKKNEGQSQQNMRRLNDQKAENDGKMGEIDDCKKVGRTNTN
jgi:uncharacterized protein (DUF3084 family)